MLCELGAIERIDADRVVHTLMRPGTETTRLIAERFGAEVLATDGAVDRNRLAEIVFHDDSALRDLERIVHPAVRQAIRARLEELRGRTGIVVIDAVRLLQSELLQLADAVWLVRCPRDKQVQRLVQLRGMSAEAAAARIAAQPDFDHARVSRVIWNGGSLDELHAQVEHAWQDLQSSVGHPGAG